MAPKTVLVTGASGFVGSHVAKAALDQGYNVVAIARGEKAAYIKKTTCPKYGDRLRVVEVDDIFSGKLDKEIFKGVDALIHVATPMPGSVPLADVVPNAVNGTLNILDQAYAAGVKTVVVTGAIGAARTPGETWKNDDWNPLTTEQAVASNNPIFVYVASKKYSELAVWEWAEKHPDVKLSVLLPSLVIGPYEREFVDVQQSTLSLTNKFVYGFIFPDGPNPPHSFYIDVRDLGKAHVNALEAPPNSVISRKRVIISAPHEFVFKDTLSLIAEKRPELKDRLNKRELPVNALKKMPCDFKKLEEIAGFKVEDFRPFEQTLFDLLDDYLAEEAKWKEQGLDTSLKMPQA